MDLLGKFQASDFEDLGNGYSKVTATSTVSGEINGVNSAIVQIIGAGTNYTGSIYIDKFNCYRRRI